MLLTCSSAHCHGEDRRQFHHRAGIGKRLGGTRPPASNRRLIRLRFETENVLNPDLKVLGQLQGQGYGRLVVPSLDGVDRLATDSNCFGQFILCQVLYGPLNFEGIR